MSKSKMEYGLDRVVEGSFNDVVERVKSVFLEEGFGTLSEIDIKAKLQEKIGETIEPYTIVGVCNPKLAHLAIGLEPEIGVLLPCNVLVRQARGQVYVTAQNPSLFSDMTGNPSLDPVAREARSRIDRALEKL